MKANKKQLKVALHGMDSHVTKTMIMFLNGPCGNAATVVPNPQDADVDIFDGDLPSSKKLLDAYFQENGAKPAIILSLWDVKEEGVFHVKKPVNTESMLMVLDEASKLIAKLAKKKLLLQGPLGPKPIEEIGEPNVLAPIAAQGKEEDVLELLNFTLEDSQRRTSPLPPVDAASVKVERDWFDDWFDSELDRPKNEAFNLSVKLRP